MGMGRPSGPGSGPGGGGAGIAALDADHVRYTNTTSGLAATDAQAAFDELAAEKIGVTTAAITLYVETTGDDANDGLTVGTALATIQEAIRRIPKYINHGVDVYVGAGNFDGFAIEGFHVGAATSGTIFSVGGSTGLVTPTTGSATGTASGGSTTTLTDAGAGWTVDDFAGKFVAVDGGVLRVIRSNTADTITIVGEFDFVPTGFTFEIVEPKTVITNAYSGGYYAIEINNNEANDHNLCIYNFKIPDTIPSGIVNIGGCGAYISQVLGDLNGVTTSLITFRDVFEPMVDRCSARSANTDGYIIENCSGPSVIKSLAINASGDAFYLSNSQRISITDLASIGCSESGVSIDGCTNVMATGNIYVYNNNGNGISVNGTNYVKIESATIDACSGYGICVDCDNNLGRTGNSCVEVTAATITNNSDKCVAVSRGAIVSLDAVVGSLNNLDDGIRVSRNAQVFITEHTTVTGASGDITINDGSTYLTYAGDFAADGDIATNMDTGSRVTRED